MKHYTIQVGGLPKSPNQIGRAHWAIQANEKREWKEKIGWLAKVNHPSKPFEKAYIHFVISTGDNRRHDPDNLAWSVTKVSLDALKGIFITDDSIDNVTLSYEFNRKKPRSFLIEIAEVIE